jgi:hypothetical protein
MTNSSLIPELLNWLTEKKERQSKMPEMEAIVVTHDLVGDRMKWLQSVQAKVAALREKERV